MSEESSNDCLRFPHLSISGFRGIRNLEIPRLGRVTLLAGANGAGKTTVLEAVQLYAARANEHVLSALLDKHEEFSAAIDKDNDRILAPDPAALFHDRKVSPNSVIVIGPAENSAEERLKVEATVPNDKEVAFIERLFDDITSDGPSLILKITFAGRERIIPWVLLPHEVESRGRRWVRLSRRIRSFGRTYNRAIRRGDEQDELPQALDCQSLGPGLLSNDETAELWDDVALTTDEDRAVQALKLMFGDTVDRVAMIGDNGRPYNTPGRRVVVKLRGRDTPVPLKSLGDGAMRLLGVALALAGSRNGFLVIDEAENGIHHSIHHPLWRMILQTAYENNVQVFATTHSFDCVKGFARAAVESETSEGILVRLERGGEQTRAVVYSEEEIKVAAEQGIEVR